MNAIPEWSSHGVFPPNDFTSPTSANRSPYRVTIMELITRFGTSQERCEILNGYLHYRSALYDAGLTEGFQWVNGSFLEHVELLESRPPRDIDVVTFYAAPMDKTENQLRTENLGLFSAPDVKTSYKVDAHYVSLNLPPALLVRRSAYWYSVWSHRRTHARMERLS